MSIIKQIDSQKMPKHIAIIMDGNGRWAKKKGRPRAFGHNQGVASVKEVVEACAEIGVEYLTLYAFSTENWNRPKYEVELLMQLLVSTIHKETKALNKNNIRLQAIGDLHSLPKRCYDELMKSIESTSKNTKTTLVLALSYSAKWEMVNAVKKIAKEVSDGAMDINEISQEVISNNLTTHSIPDPELLIRTSGEQRISNFLLWQIAYSELYFVEKLWPEFGKEDLFEAIVNYQNRERRFGLTSEQVK